MNKTKVIIFDFDGTLYSGETFDKWGDYIRDAIVEILPDEKKRAEFVEKYHIIPDAISSNILAEILRQELGTAQPYIDYENTHIYALKLNQITAIDNEYISNLAKRYPLIIVSNSSHEHIRHYLKEFGISEDNFSAIYQNLFEELGKGKYYIEVMNNYQCNSDELIVIGDNYESDILPATKLGIRGYLIHNLDEVKQVIQDNC